MHTWNEIQDCHCKSNIQQKEDSFRLKIGLKFKEEVGEMLRLEHSFVWCWNFDTSERSEIP